MGCQRRGRQEGEERRGKETNLCRVETEGEEPAVKKKEHRISERLSSEEGREILTQLS